MLGGGHKSARNGRVHRFWFRSGQLASVWSDAIGANLVSSAGLYRSAGVGFGITGSRRLDGRSPPL
jgi:hypothetical protein